MIKKTTVGLPAHLEEKVVSVIPRERLPATDGTPKALYDQRFDIELEGMGSVSVRIRVPTRTANLKDLVKKRDRLRSLALTAARAELEALCEAHGA